MGVRQSGLVVVLCGLALAAPAEAAQERADNSGRDLRSRMAGAWRSVPGDSPPHSGDDSRNESDDQRQQTENARSAASAAQSSQPAQLDQMLYFDGDLCVLASRGRQVIFNVRYEDGVARRTEASTGTAVPGELTIEDGLLVMRVPPLPFKLYFRRLDKIPESVRLDPYPLGKRIPDNARRAAIQKEIARRMQRDQGARMKALEARKQGGFDAAQTLASIDQENARRMVELIQDVGWLSKARFGAETQLGAFLIVQHSGNLRLMRTVLPLVREEAKGDPNLGQHYALLYDRVQLALGRKQRYGTQTRTNADGSLTICRLEDSRRVDEWRRQMGMEPLEDYARNMARQYGVKVTIGE